MAHRPVPSDIPSALKSADRNLGQRTKSFVQTNQVYESLLAPFVDVGDGIFTERQVNGPDLWGVQSAPSLILPPNQT